MSQKTNLGWRHIQYLQVFLFFERFIGSQVIIIFTNNTICSHSHLAESFIKRVGNTHLNKCYTVGVEMFFDDDLQLQVLEPSYIMHRCGPNNLLTGASRSKLD